MCRLGESVFVFVLTTMCMSALAQESAPKEQPDSEPAPEESTPRDLPDSEPEDSEPEDSEPEDSEPEDSEPEDSEPAPKESTPQEQPDSEPAPKESTPQESDEVFGFEGIVIDPTGVPVKGATVIFPDKGVELKTAADGTFTAPIQPGVHKVIVEAPGLESLVEMVDLDESAAMSGFELLMEFPMEDVVVTGTKTEKLIEKAPIKTQVVGRKDIERKKASTLADTLEATSGVRVENNCQNCGFTQVRLNGLEGRYTQILIDGNPVFSSLAGVYGLEQIPQEMIERVEIVKGGGSALYGGNAVGGVVNVITARPRQNFANFTIRGGVTGLAEPDFRLGASSGVVNKARDLALHVFGSAYSREPWDANGDGFSEIGQVRQVMIGAETYIDVPNDGEFLLKFHALQENRRGGDSFDKPEHDAAIAESTKTQRYGGELRFKQLVNSHLNYELGYGFAYTERDSYYGGGGDVFMDNPPTAEQWATKQSALGAYGNTKNPVHTANATANFAYSALGEQIITVGGQYLSDGLVDKFPSYNREIDERYWNLAGILQHDWMFTDKIETVIGVRFDKHSELNNPVVSPRAALMFEPLGWLKARTSFSSGFRAPQAFDEDLHITIVGGEGQIVYNDSNLNPERSYSLAQQIEFDFHLKKNWEIKWSINGFWTRINDAFVLDMDDDPNTVGEIEMFRRNRGATTVYGAELEANLIYDDAWGLSAGWTWGRSENTEEDPDFGTKALFRTPETYGFVNTWIDIVGGLEISTALEITGPMKIPHYSGYIAEATLEESPWFADWSANLSYKVELGSDRYLSPFIGIKNILDNRQNDYDVGADRDAGYIYGPRLPRTIFAGIKGGI